MKKYLVLAFFAFIGNVSNAQMTAVVVKSSDNLLLEEGYINEKGQRDSTWIAYNDNGPISQEGSYIRGENDGVWNMYDDNGRKSFQVTFKNGKKRKGKQWNSQGHLIDVRKWDSEGNLICETIRKY